MTKLQLEVRGMTCAHCRATVEKALRTLAGVVSAEVDLEGGRASVTYDEAAVSPDAMIRAIEEEGYEAQVVASA